jgi:Ca2+/Na+ antiporter
MVSLIACTIAIVWFELSVQSIFYNKHILSSTAITIGLSTGLAGLFQGAASPLIYEALAEIMYPLPESLSASILVQWINVVTLVFLFVAPNRGKLVNFLVLVVMIICLFLILITRFSYKRRDEDERKRIEKEQNQLATENNLNEPIVNSVNERQYGTFSPPYSENGLEDQYSHQNSNGWKDVRSD